MGSCLRGGKMPKQLEDIKQAVEESLPSASQSRQQEQPIVHEVEQSPHTPPVAQSSERQAPGSFLQRETFPFRQAGRQGSQLSGMPPLPGSATLLGSLSCRRAPEPKAEMRIASIVQPQDSRQGLLHSGTSL